MLNIYKGIKPFRKYAKYMLSGLVLFLFSFRPPSITVINYDVRTAGIKIGTLKATREIKEDGITNYSLVSDVSVYILKRYHIKDEVNCVYKSGIMQSATINTLVGSKKYYSTVKWVKDHYDININTYKYTKTAIETTPIQYSVARIYFEEPPATSKVFSEDYGVFSGIGVTGAHAIQVIFAGKKDKFSFSNGQVQKADMQSTVRDFIIERK